MSVRGVETPEIDRQLAIIESGKAEIVQEFLDWLLGERGYTFCFPKHNSLHGYFVPAQTYSDPEQLMAEFFGIDLAQVEKERRAILDAIREKQS